VRSGNFAKLMLGCFLSVFGMSHAQERYPTRPLTMVFPYPPGGFDAMARGFGDALAQALGQPVVLVNRDGAAGRVAFENFISASPDGHSLIFSPSAPLTSVPHMQKGVTYRHDSFEPVCQVYENTFTLSVPVASSFKSMLQLVEYAKNNPGKLTFGHPGIGAGPHLAVEGLAHQMGLRFLPIPYRGGGQMLVALAAGQVDFSAPGIASVMSRKDMRALAIFSAKRNPLLPEIPTVTELGLASIASDPQGVFAPKGTPKAVLGILENACRSAVGTESLRAIATKLLQVLEFLPGSELARRQADDSASKELLIRSLGIRTE